MLYNESMQSVKLDRRVKQINDELEQANQKLRDSYFTFNDFKLKGQLRLEKRIVASGKQQYDFDLNAQEYFYEQEKGILLERPDVQEHFNNSIVQLLQSDVVPPKTSMYADQVTKSVKKWFKSTQSPSQIKYMLIGFFKRELLNLKMKKIKTMQRYTQQSDKHIHRRDQFFRSRINLIDFEIIALIKRRERLKCDEGLDQAFQSVGGRPRQAHHLDNLQTHITDDEELCFSNITKDDIEVYIRQSQFINKTSRKLMKLIRQVRWIHCEFRFDIMRNANQKMFEMKQSNIDRNFTKFQLMWDALERATQERFPHVPEIKVIVLSLFEQTKFNLGEDKEYNSLQSRFDSLPFLPMFHKDADISFQFACDYYLTKQSIDNLSTQSLLFRLNNLVGLIFQHQNRLTDYQIMKQGNVIKQFKIIPKQFNHNDVLQQYFKKTSERVSDMTLLEEQQLKSYLKRPIENKNQLIKVPEDWLKLLIFQPDIDRYQQMTMNLLDDVICDAQVRLIQQVVCFKDEQALRKYVQQNSQEIVNQSHDVMFMVGVNKKYVEQTHLQISLDLLNELFDETKKQIPDKDLKQQYKDKIKEDSLQSVETLFNEIRPQQNIVETTCLLNLLIIREQRIKIEMILNARRSIERRITYDLLMLFDCKMHRDMDMEMILSVAEQQDQSKPKQDSSKDDEKKEYQKNQPLKRRDNMIDFIQARRKLDDGFIRDLQSDASLGRWDKIHIMGDGYTRVLSNRSQGLSEKEIIYDIVEQDLIKLETRLSKTASLYINKYEKINRVVENMGFIVNKYELLRDLWLKEQSYQSTQLGLLMQYITLYDNITDPVEQYKLSKVILNEMASQPILDSQSVSFGDAYDLNTHILQAKIQIIRDLIIMQGQEEHNENRRLYGKLNLFGQTEEFEEDIQIQVKQDKMQTKASQVRKTEVEKEDQYEIEIIEEYMLERNMDNVFAELSETKQTLHEEETLQPTQSKRQSIQRIGKYLLCPESQLKLRFEGYPHYLYGNLVSREVGETYDHFLDFTNSMMLVRTVIQKCDEAFYQLIEELPQKSTSMILCVKLCLLQEVYESLTKKEVNVGKIEECDETTLLQTFQVFSEQVMSELQEYRSDPSTQTSRDWNAHAKVKQSLIHYDQSTLDAYLFHKKPPHLTHYRGLYLMCNLVEYLKLREELILTLVEGRTINRVYKKQRQYLNVKVHKHKDLQSKESSNFKHTFNLAREDTTHYQKKSTVVRSVFLEEVDESYSQSLKDTMIFVMPDGLEEMRTILIYEIANMELIAQQCLVWNSRCDKISHITMELDLLITNKVFCEQNYLDTERVFHSQENFKKMRKTIEQLNDHAFFVGVNEKPIYKKLSSLQVAEKKFQEAHDNLLSQNKGNTNLAITLLCQKRLRKLSYNLSNSFKFMLFRMVIQDIMREVCQDAHKIHLIQTCRSIQKLCQTFPNCSQIFMINHDTLPEELDKRIYYEQRKNIISSKMKKKAQLSTPQMNLVNPFYIMGVEDVFKSRDNNQPTTFISHVGMVEPSSVGYMSTFYVMSTGLNETKLQQPLDLVHLKYIHEISNHLQGRKQDQFVQVAYMNNNLYSLVRLLKYYTNMLQFIQMQYYKVQTRLDQGEMQILLDLYTLNQGWVSQSLTGHNKALMSYEEKFVDVNDDAIEPLNKQVIVHEAIDNIVQRVRNNIQLQESFGDLTLLLQNIIKHTQDNVVLVDQLSQLFKRKASTTYKSIYWAFNETLGQSFERNMQTNMASKLFKLHELLYSDYRSNTLSIKHFKIRFYNIGVGQFERTNKNPMFRTNDINRMFGAQKHNSIVHKIVKNSAMNLRRFLFTQDRKKFQSVAEQSQDFLMCQQGNWFSKVKQVKSLTDRGYMVDDGDLYNISLSLSKLTQFERRMIQSNFKSLETDSLIYAKFKLQKQYVDISESNDLEDSYVNQHLQLTLVRQALLLQNHNVDFPLFSFEYLRYLSDTKIKIQFNVVNLKALARNPVELALAVLNKQQQKFLDVTSESKPYVYECKFLDNLIGMLVEKELCYKELYVQNQLRGEKSMQEDIEMLTTFRKINENLAERHKLQMNKQKIISKLVLGNTTMLPRVKNNPCFSSRLQRESKQDKMIPSQAKISFLQAFINRLRNKVSRVDLLSSGSGFVITINDLEDCVNFLHKSMYQFGEKELRARLETCQLVYDHQHQIIVDQGEEIITLKLKLDQLLFLVEKNSEAIIIQKGNQLLYDFDAINRKLKDFNTYTQGLECNLREQIRKEFLKENLQLKNEKELLQQKLEDFKKELLVLCKNEIRSHQSDLIKFVKVKALEILQTSTMVDEVKDKSKKMFDDFSFDNSKQPDISFLMTKPKKCAPDEDVIFDPYVTTKWVNKIRAFYIIKLGSLKQRHSDDVMRYDQKIQSLQEVSQKMRDFQERETILKRELVSLHETLYQQKRVNDNLMMDMENLFLENKRILKINEDQKQLKQRLNTDRATKRMMSLDTATKFPNIQTEQQKTTITQHSTSIDKSYIDKRYTETVQPPNLTQLSKVQFKYRDRNSHKQNFI